MRFEPGVASLTSGGGTDSRSTQNFVYFVLNLLFVDGKDLMGIALIASRLANPLAQTTGNAVLSFGLDRAALVAEVPPHLLAHCPAYLVGQRG
jgi:hypothetical protein